jgi:hypothetical protein
MNNELIDLLEFLRENGWVLLGILLPIAYVFGLPLLTLATFRSEALPVLEPATHEFGLFEDSGPFLEIARAHFARLGFEELDTLCLPHQMANVKVVLRPFVNRSEQDTAIAVAMYALLGNTWTQQTQYVEITSLFRDGTSIGTRNAKEIPSFPPQPGKIQVTAPWLTDIADLYKAHQALCGLKAHGKVKELPLDAKYQGDVVAYLTADMIEEFDDAVRIGYLRYVNAGSASDRLVRDEENPYRSPRDASPSAYYAATLRGAYLMTWNELWPFKSWIRSRYYRQARRLLAEAGMTE